MQNEKMFSLDSWRLYVFLKEPVNASSSTYQVGEHIFLMYLYHSKNNKIITLTPESCCNKILRKEINHQDIFFTIQHFLIREVFDATNFLAQALDVDEGFIDIVAYNISSPSPTGVYPNYVWEVTEMYGEKMGRRKFYTDVRYVLKIIEENYDFLGELGEVIANNFPESRKLVTHKK